MNKKAFWLSIMAIIISFVGGFLLANALNRKELDDLRAEVGRLKKSPQMAGETNSSSNLSDDEIRQKIVEADKNPENIEFQKSLAIALYSYASMKQDITLLPEVSRLLERVYAKNNKDYNAIISIANVNFDIGQNKRDAKFLHKSREFYQKALEIKPDDADVRTDLGLTYLSADPPENEKATAEFQKSLQLNPTDERTLKNLIETMIKSGKIGEAEEYFKKFKQANPNSAAIPALEMQLSQSKNNK